MSVRNEDVSADTGLQGSLTVSLPKSLIFGWGRPSFAKQLAMVPVDPVEIEHLEKDADALSRLTVRGIITHSERDKAIKRCIKRFEPHIQAALAKAGDAP